jgi:hypothetical protein
MRGLYVILLAVALHGCISSRVVPPRNGYVRVENVAGCFQHTDPREPNVVLGWDLEASLRSTLPERPVLEQPQCWYEKSPGTILLVSGPECLAFDEFIFTSNGNKWELAQTHRSNIVICDDQRAR